MCVARNDDEVLRGGVQYSDALGYSTCRGKEHSAG